ncbi:hypothetical protein DSECCO2_634520 [anaerobic digester metagenome]
MQHIPGVIHPLECLLLDLSPDDLKIGILSCGFFPSDGERFDGNGSSYDIDRVDEIPEVLLAPLCNDLDLPVLEIHHVPRDIPFERLVVHMLPIADPLDTPPCSGHKSFHSISLCMMDINNFSRSTLHPANLLSGPLPAPKKRSQKSIHDVQSPPLKRRFLEGHGARLPAGNVTGRPAGALPGPGRGAGS